MVVPRRVKFRPRYFERGELTRLALNFIREHAGQTVAPNRIARRFVLSAGDRARGHVADETAGRAQGCPAATARGAIIVRGFPGELGAKLFIADRVGKSTA
jgi:hypothetical protein